MLRTTTKFYCVFAVDFLFRMIIVTATLPLFCTYQPWGQDRAADVERTVPCGFLLSLLDPLPMFHRVSWASTNKCRRTYRECSAGL